MTLALYNPQLWYAIKQRNQTKPIRFNKWLLIVDEEFFLYLSCQNPGNFVPMNHPDRLKKFQMDWVIPYLWIFQTQRGYRSDK